ncbi:MAG: hypothetical protein JST17_02400 [Bacteroidetes bacterium]|nr:hypothetical protein [Bacteroidota bacterium]MBS1931321.1 hypothetical protein [Bacteroidota bacterium]
MQWELLSSITEPFEFILWHHKKILLTLTFHPGTNSVRVESEKERRVFLIRNEGFLKSKTVLRNEYGVQIGQIRHENKEHYIEMGNQKYLYLIRNNSIPEVLIYKDSKENPVIVCELNFTNNYFSNNKNLPAKVEPSLLLSLCWHLLGPKSREKSTILLLQEE